MSRTIHVWLASAQHGPWARARQHLLNAPERARLAALGQTGHDGGQAYLLSRVLRRVAVSALTGVPPEAWSFGPNALGQPVPQLPPAWGTPPGCTNLGVSLAHCQDTVVVAVGEGGALGVDIEHAHRFGARYERPARLAERLLTPMERQRLEALPQALRPLGFLQQWALKEAAAKALGQGLRGPWRKLAPDVAVGPIAPGACRFAPTPLRLPQAFAQLVPAPLWCALVAPPDGSEAVVALAASGLCAPDVRYRGLGWAVS